MHDIIGNRCYDEKTDKLQIYFSSINSINSLNSLNNLKFNEDKIDMNFFPPQIPPYLKLSLFIVYLKCILKSINYLIIHSIKGVLEKEVYELIFHKI